MIKKNGIYISAEKYLGLGFQELDYFGLAVVRQRNYFLGSR
jgi:hypothetical protein